uniref:Uncharacterized protein n=1 Tax=Anguilla anguilla TaxID=7936 RepID=A0A0E9T2L1_ANGAN
MYRNWPGTLSDSETSVLRVNTGLSTPINSQVSPSRILFLAPVVSLTSLFESLLNVFKRSLKSQFPLPYKATDPASLAVVIFFFNAVIEMVLITRRDQI